MNIEERPKQALVEIIDKVLISGEEKSQKLELAKKLKNFNELSQRAGVGSVYIFEHEEDLRNEIIKSCHFMVSIGFDSTIAKISFSRSAEERVIEYPVNLNLGIRIKFECIPDDLYWLIKTKDFALVPTAKGFSFSDDITTVTKYIDSQLYIEKKILAAMRGLSKDDILPSNPVPLAMPRACFLMSTGKFYTENPSMLRTAKLIKHRPLREERHPTGYILGCYASNEDYIEDSKTEFFDASQIFESYDSLIKSQIEILNSGVDVNLVLNKGHDIIDRFNSSINRVFINRFKTEIHAEKLSPEEIYKMIGRYFDVLIDSPWNGETNGMYADLKELCKKSYKNLHIWSNNIKGYYGFKIKNRNHKWIVGEIYCPVDALAPSSNQIIPEVFFEKRDGRYEQRSHGWGSSYYYPFRYEGDIVSVGPCKFYIGRTI